MHQKEGLQWQVSLHPQVQKTLLKLPARIQTVLGLLVKEMRSSGPVRGDWPNYAKLGPGRHHCHLKKGRPTFVAVWEELDGKAQIIEVTYVGTHEKAPY